MQSIFLYIASLYLIWEMDKLDLTTALVVLSLGILGNIISRMLKEEK